MSKLKNWLDKNQGWVAALTGLFTIAGTIVTVIFTPIATFRESPNLDESTNKALVELQSEVIKISHTVVDMKTQMPDRFKERWLEVCEKCNIK